MKKVYLIVQDKDASESINALSVFGSFHVENQTIPASLNLDELKKKQMILQKVISVLTQSSEKIKQDDLPGDGVEQAEGILEQVSLIAQLEENISERQMEIGKWEPWGDFNIEDMSFLKEKGINLKLAEVSPDVFKKIQGAGNGYTVEVLSKRNNMFKIAVVVEDDSKLFFDTIKLPEIGLKEMKKMQESDRNKIQEAKDKIESARKYINAFKKAFVKVQESLAFEEAYSGRKEEESLALLKGFCPIDRIDELSSVAKKEQWGVILEDPTDDDKVPTLIKNPKWVEIISPMFQMMNIIPGYKEFDISLSFLLFFSVFVGALVGDAAYGMIFMIITALAHLKMRNAESKSLFYLMYVLSAMTIIWGLLTGTFFGQAWLPQNIRPLLPWLRESRNVQLFCFVLGAFHLSLAHVWRGILKFPSLPWLSEVGWVCIIWVMFFLARVLILSESFPQFTSLLLAIGFILIVVFTKPSKNLLKGLLAGLGDLAGNLMNAFTDIVSYIRIFAVGLATVAVADAINQMALNVGFNSIVAGLLTAIILFTGHLLNIVLSVMAVLVHGVRLNVLEFSSHLNMEWTGFKYSPLKSIKHN